jgi:hypothetical protein
MKKKPAIYVDMSGVDWKLLRDQKNCLIKVSANWCQLAGKNKDIVPAIHWVDGIISLLDNIQDEAAKQVGEKKVFGGLK